LFQAELAARWGGPVLSLTVVSPGPVKNSPRIDRVFTAAVKAVAGLLADRGWRALERCRRLSAAGPELLMAVEANPAALKSALADLEDLHPLGRLWDADVLKAGRPLSRAAVGRPRRRCLVCGAAAAPCARSRRHSLAELDAAVEALLFHG
jgi:holo-ACP synthase CitX